MPLTYAQLTQTHPEYDAPYWRQLRALCTGGARLLRDTKLLSELMPQHSHERNDIYSERLKRALYFPYPSDIVGDLVAQLAEDPLQITADPQPDAFYGEFERDVDRKGMSLTAFAQHQVRTALVCRTAWALADLPSSDEVYETRAEEDEAGMRRAYLVPLDPECVTDWEEDDDGCLLWACVSSTRKARETPGDKRGVIVERFTFYFPDRWERYVVEYKDGKPPKPTQSFEPKTGPHTFGCVPLLRFELPDELWALDKLYAAARAFLNQRSAFSWSQFKHLFPLLVAFLGPEAPSGEAIPSEAQQNPSRATDQVYGQGYVNTFGKEDKLNYVSPPADVFDVAARDLDKLRDEMHRVTQTMALSTDNSASALGRSGDSKRQDRASKDVVAKELGKRVAEHVRHALELVAAGRRDEHTDWQVSGFADFDSTLSSDAVEAATAIEALDIPSPTFHRVHKRATAQRIVRHDATPKELQAIEREINANVTDEAFSPHAEPDGDEGDPLEGEDDEDTEDDGAGVNDDDRTDPTARPNGRGGRRGRGKPDRRARGTAGQS